jgi:two-component system OmpR family response regulator
MATIRMIDDDADLAAALKVLLGGKGRRFHTAANGELGLRRVKDTSPDLIILDVTMDRDTDGFRVARRTRDTSDDSEYAPCRGTTITVRLPLAAP